VPRSTQFLDGGWNTIGGQSLLLLQGACYFDELVYLLALLIFLLIGRMITVVNVFQ